jgi:glycerol-3-phosphate dehydrogenase (NAD(P)+)
MVLADAGCEVALWGRRPDITAAINTTRVNPAYSSEITLPATVTATTDPAEAAAGAEFVFLAVPSQSLRANLADWAPLLRRDAVLVSLMKGVELGTAKRMSEVVEEVARSTPSASRCSPAPTWPPRSPPASPRPRSSPAGTRRSPAVSRPPATPPTTAPTPTPT